MCGIVGVFGKENAPKYVLKGLRNLEYRGYDSWGIGAPCHGEVCIEKQIGKISEAKLPEDFPKSTIAIGHTRWATHGGVTPENAHPHCTEDKKVAVVHNGIIENFSELRQELILRGHLFASDTDTEVLCHLLEEFLEEGEDLVLACKKTADRCEGRFAFVAVSSEDHRLVGVRNGSPLILGLGKNHEVYFASDTPSFLEHTNHVWYIDDGEIVEASEKSLRVLSLDSLQEIQKRDVLLETSYEETHKGDHAHFMIKEIYEQKNTIAQAINQPEDEILKIAEEIRRARGTFLIGCGTAHKVALAGEYFFSQIARRHINTVVASEFPIFHDFLQPESLVIAISQSGETADVIEAIEAAREAGSEVVSIVNSEGSTVDRMSDFTIHIKAGPEKAVASTKAATSQLAVLLLLAYATGRKFSAGKKALIEAAAQVNDLLNPRFSEFLEKIAQSIADKENIFIIGKGSNYPMALESAIKIQEVSYIHAEGFAAGELKHGPIAMIEKGTPCLVLVSDNDRQRREILSNAMEIKARGGNIIGIAPDNSEIFDHWIRVPRSGIASPILNLIPVQILSYYLAIARGFDPDKPRNLAKSVTVK